MTLYSYCGLGNNNITVASNVYSKTNMAATTTVLIRYILSPPVSAILAKIPGPVIT